MLDLNVQYIYNFLNLQSNSTYAHKGLAKCQSFRVFSVLMLLNGLHQLIQLLDLLI